MKHRHFDEYVDALIERGISVFTEKFRWHVLVGLYIVGELDDDATRGGHRTFSSKIDDDANPGLSLRRRIWPIRKGKYGPEVPTVRLGRLADMNDVIVQDYSVSTVHLEFGQQDQQVWVADLGSHNGTFVDDCRLQVGERVPLDDQCELIVGRVKFEYLTRETFYDRVRAAAESPLLQSG